MKLRPSDTIAAIATPPGDGAVSVLRLSGPDALTIADRVFRGSSPLCDTPGYVIRHGSLLSGQGEVIDEVLVSVFRRPHSYTGEDCVEIGCHGGSVVTRRVLAALLEQGARQADPGEFTKRAFLNGKLDLAQAEAVADLIAARTERAARNAARVMRGALREELLAVRREVLEVCALVELQLDFAEEEIPVVTREELKGRIAASKDRLQLLLDGAAMGRLLRDGVSVAIVGRPNAGKSSLFNRLLSDDRAIVSPRPGTTRDFIEESITLEGIQVRLVDTAGLRHTDDELELAGIGRTSRVIDTADIVLLVVDATVKDSLSPDLAELSRLFPHSDRTVIAVNKSDLVGDTLPVLPNAVNTSALTGHGIESLRNTIVRAALAPSHGDAGVFLCSERQLAGIRESVARLLDASQSCGGGLPAECVADDLRNAVNPIGDVLGEFSSEEVLNAIFARFCIGK